MKRNLSGWRRQAHDHRDFRFQVPARRLATLPAAVDLSPSMPPADDQGDLGSCGPNSADVLLQYDQKSEKLPVFPTSRLFIYYATRSIMGTTSQDSGVDNRSMMQALAKYGFCPETLWPYDISKFTSKPPAAAYTAAAANTITSYAFVDVVLDQMRGTLAEGFPILFGADVFSEIQSDAVAKTGIIPMPKKGETPIGGHDVAFVGYDDVRQMFKFLMPWGKSWGINGYGWWPYAYATNAALCSDLCVINAVPGVAPQPPTPPTPPPSSKVSVTFSGPVAAGSYVMTPASSAAA